MPDPNRPDIGEPLSDPRISVVIPVHNGAVTLPTALESVFGQRERPHEVIVVDDGSTDGTPMIAERYPLVLVRHHRNLGIGAARATGLHHVTGNVCACFDADSVADPMWLAALAETYRRVPQLCGVGSVVEMPHSRKSTLADRYFARTGSGAAPKLGLADHRTALGRYIAYLGDQFQRAEVPANRLGYWACQLYSASASFRTDVVRYVGGWDSDFRFMEDLDLSDRIRDAFPDGGFYVSPDARIYHQPDMSLRALVVRPFCRAGFNRTYHGLRNKIVPIFPHPIAWLVGGVVLGAAGQRGRALRWLFVGPGALYPWWLRQALRERSALLLLFPLLQMAEELSSSAGLILASFTGRRGTRRASRAEPRGLR